MTVDTQALRDKIAAAQEKIGGIATTVMRGDNLAITLCSYFETFGDGEVDDNGWTESALEGCGQTLEAIRTHYDPIMSGLLDRIDHLQARLTVAEDALQGIVDNYPTDMNHVDFRVRACHEAADALAAIRAIMPITTQNDTVEESGQAGAFKEIEVTPEMIAAGLDELRDRRFDDGLDYVLESVYRAMAYEREAAASTNAFR